MNLIINARGPYINEVLTKMSEEYLVDIKIEKLEGGKGYLATSDTIQGLVAQGRTIAETMEIARDVARKIIDSCIEHGDPLPAKLKAKRKAKFIKDFKIPIPVGAGM